MSRSGTPGHAEARALAALEARAYFGRLRASVQKLKREVARLDRRMALIAGSKPLAVSSCVPSIATLRRKLGISKSRLALLLGIHRNSVRRLERKRTPNLRTSVVNALIRVSKLTRAAALAELYGTSKPSTGRKRGKTS